MSDEDSLELHADAGVQLVTADSPRQLIKDDTQQQPPPPHSQEGSSIRSKLFMWFVAAVVISQRRAVLAHCCDADDVLRLFQGMKRVDVWQCLAKARELQSEDALQQQQAQPLQQRLGPVVDS
ncbi:hypothetical protein COO60DRAFT_1515818 [Scenedesmus sp. NREL 46B-D3]|nr:hypothetical protein COO60DRAFT_1515818 [Scenedesmus sp. NREL 46B-D3]